MAIKKAKKHKALAASALGLLGLAPQTASADTADSQTALSTSSAASSNSSSVDLFAKAASSAHAEFSSAADLLDSSNASSLASSHASSPASDSVSAKATSLAESFVSDAKTETAENNGNVKDAEGKTDTVKLNAKNALKTPKMMAVSKMAMVRSASTKLADQYEARAAEYTEIYGQTIDPKSLISNFSDLPTGTTASAANLDTIKTKQGRNVVPVTVTYSDGSTDTVNATLWVTPQGTTALAKSVTLKSNETWDKESVTVDAQQTVPLEFYFSGSAVLDASTVKKGARIYFAQVAEKYNEPMANGQNKKYIVLDGEGNKLGYLVAMNPNSSVGGGSVNLYLDVTEDKEYQNDVTVKFEIPNDQAIYNTDQSWARYREIYLTNTDDPYDYSGTIVQKRYLHTAGQSDREWTINRTISKIATADPWFVSHRGAGISPEYTSISFPSGMLLGYEGASLNPNVLDQNTIHKANQLAKEIWASKGKIVPSDMPAKQNLHEVWQYITPTGSYYQNTRLTGVLWGSKQLMTVDGLPSNQASRLQYYNDESDLCYMAPDGTSIQALYDMTPSGRIGFSRQGNDTYLICFNLTADDLRPNEKSIEALVDSNPAMALSKDYEKLKQVNVDFYANNAVASFASWYNDAILLYLSSRNDTNKAGNYYLQDVTPGHAVYATKATLATGSASAGGKTKRNNTYYFVDDSQNQAIVGGTHQISGGVGDTVPLNLTVPSGYILDSGQSLPTSYTFDKTNSDIVIHLVPIYKSESLTDTVNRTINYKTTDGSNAPASKSDSLTFYGTKTIGNLSSLIDRAQKDDLTVNKGEAKEYSTKEEALADLDKQAQAIQSALVKYEAEKAAYDAAKKVYDQDLAKWNDSQSSSHVVKGVSQSLSFNGETDAELKVSTDDNSPVHYIKSKAWLGQDRKGVYSYDNITKSFGDSDISYSFAEGTATDSSSWGKTYTGVQMKTGQSIIAQYTGLRNSVYIDETGKAHKLSKVKIKYTLNSTTANDGTANVFLSSNPNTTLWFSAAGDNKDGSVDFTVNMTFYDQDGNEITLGKGSNAWLNMSSLNHKDAIEYFAPGENTAKEIPGSTVVHHDDGLWYSDINNEEHGKEWDSPTSADRYYGAAIMELGGESFHIGKKITGSPAIYDWYAIDTSLATAYKPIEPKEPVKPVISWHEVSNTVWDGPKDFVDVMSPPIAGYTPNRKAVSNKGVAHDAQDITETVTYTPDIQNVTITYVDGTTGQTLTTENRKGPSNTRSGYTSKNTIDHYKNLGYVLEHDTTNGQEIVFDSDSSVNQSYTVTLLHDYQTITPTSPQTPNVPINPDPNGAKYPEGVDKASLEDDVTRRITYVMADGSTAPSGVSQTLHYTANKTIDKVTGQITNTEWSENQDFDDVDSPDIQGYTPDTETVVDENIEHSHADIVHAVRYTPDKQTATVTYIDDTTGDVLDNVTISGVSNAKSGYKTKPSIDSYVASGYDLISDSTNGQEIVYDNDGDVDQEYTVHFKHRLVKPTDDQHVHRTVVTRKINYEMADNSAAPTSRTLSLSFLGQDTVDAVTKKTVKTDWTPDQTFDAVVSPDIQGYTPDIKIVPSIIVSHDSASTTVTVRYTPDPQRATITYIDDTTGKTLDTAVLNGVSNAKSGYTTKSAIDAYSFIGYQFVSDDTNGQEIVFDHDDAADQSYTVHMKRTYEQIPSPQKKYVHRTIIYRMSDNSSAPVSITQTLTFTGKDTIDKITKQVISTVWSEDQTFAEVASPLVNGYTPDKAVIDQLLASPSSSDSNVVVTYTPNPISMTVAYVDKVTGKTLKTDSVSGLLGQMTDYSTTNTIEGYESHGYTLLSDPTGANPVIMAKTNFVVYLGHGTKMIDNAELKTVTRTIHYVVNGDIPAPSNKVDVLTFTAKEVRDLVTGQVLSTTWSPNRNFDDVVTPSIFGYTPDKAVVSNYNISHDSPNIEVTVTYTRDKPSVPIQPIIPESSITISYIDQTTGEVIEKDMKTGKSASSLDYQTAGQIKNLENAGYILVKDETAGRALTFGDSNQSYSVVLKHGQAIDGVAKTVARTINYVMSDGTTPPSSKHDSLTFKETIVKDKVTGQIVSADWTPAQDFEDITSPVIKGYTASREVVSNKNIAHDHEDIIETVIYRPNTQKATLTYLDQTTGKILEAVDLSGYTNSKSGYTTENSLKIWEAYGYELVNDETGGKPVYFDNSQKDQSYLVTLKHAAKEEKFSALVDRKIDYHMADGSNPPASKHDSLTFTAVAKIDKVTGKIVKTTWSSPQNFEDAVSPALTGYTPDRTVVSNTDIAHDHPSIHEVVTYYPDTSMVKIIYVDETADQTLRTDDLQGKVGSKLSYSAKSLIDAFENRGYALISDDTDGKDLVFDESNKNYYIRLGHRYVVVTPNHPGKPGERINSGALWPKGTDKGSLTKTVTRTIKYVMQDGSNPPSQVKNSKTFVAKATVDEVTGQLVDLVWSDAQTFDKVDSPAVDGYIPDKKSLPSIAVSHTSSDIVETVTYTAVHKMTVVNFVDDLTNSLLSSKTLTGKAMQKSGYSIAKAVKDYEAHGYELVQDDTNGRELLFDGKTYTVRLTHKTDRKLEDHKATRTIKLHFKDGVKTITQVSYVMRVVKTDLATGKIAYDDWSKNKWNAVDLPVAVGFTPSQTSVTEKTVGDKTPDETVDVYYVKSSLDANANIPVTAPKTEPKTKPKTEPKAKAPSSANVPAKTKAKTEVKTKAKIEVKTKTKIEPKTEPKTEAKTKTKTFATATSVSVANQTESIQPVKTEGETLPQTGSNDLESTIQALLGLTSAITAGGLSKKRRKNKK